MDYIKRLQEAEKRRAKIVKLRSQNKTHQEIAARMGISQQRVSQILKLMGEKPK